MVKDAINKILDILTKDKDKWFSTNQIAKLSKVNWYRAQVILTDLYHKGTIKRGDTKTKGKMWALKNG